MFFGIDVPDMLLFVFWGAATLIALFGFIFAKKAVSQKNQAIIKKGKDEPMTEAEMKRRTAQDRFFLAFLFIICLANFVELLPVIFPR